MFAKQTSPINEYFSLFFSMMCILVERISTHFIYKYRNNEEVGGKNRENFQVGFNSCTKLINTNLYSFAC